MSMAKIYFASPGEADLAGAVAHQNGVRLMVRNPENPSSLFVKCCVPLSFTLRTVNTRFVQLSLIEVMRDIGFSQSQIESQIQTAKITTGQITLTLDGEDIVVYVIQLPKGLPIKSVKVEGAGEGSEWRIVDDTFMAVINHSSPVTVVIALETVAEVIVGFTSAIMVLMLVTSMIKPLFEKALMRKK